MTAPLSLYGQRFNRLVVVKRSPSLNGRTFWHCRCDCGKEKTVWGSALTTGETQSCGCLQKERASIANTKHGISNKSTEYMTWINIKTRCYNTKVDDYKDYGERGIKVCERWLNSFEAFLADMGMRPSKKHSIDRINTNGDYEPSNCRWATASVQARNKRTNRWFEYDGNRMILEDWACYFGANQGNLSHSIKARGFDGAYMYYLAKHGTLPVK